MSCLNLAALCALWIWFLGCTISWRFGKILLVEGMGLKSIEFAVLILYTIGIALYAIFPHAGSWVLVVELSLWLAVQFFCHEYFTIFGASEKKLSGYNKSFEGTLKLHRENNTRIIPDVYHIVLHLLIATNLSLIVADLL